jgi:hypothetical protein
MVKPEHLHLIGSPGYSFTIPHTFVVTLDSKPVSEEELEEIGYSGIRTFEELCDASYDFAGSDQNGSTLAVWERPYEFYISTEFSPDEIRDMLVRIMDELNAYPCDLDDLVYIGEGSDGDPIVTEEYLSALERGDIWKREMRFEVV